MTKETNKPLIHSDAEAWLEACRTLLPLNAHCWKVTFSCAANTMQQSENLSDKKTDVATGYPFFRPCSKIFKI